MENLTDIHSNTEAYHRWTKHDLSANSSICDLMWHLRGQDNKKIRHDKLVELKIRNVGGSHFQNKIKHSHKINQMAGYTIQKSGSNYTVTVPPSQQEEEGIPPSQEEEGEVPEVQTYTLFPNPRSFCVELNGDGEVTCECQCPFCPGDICAHQHCCNCDAYKRQQVCKHLHLIPWYEDRLAEVAQGDQHDAVLEVDLERTVSVVGDEHIDDELDDDRFSIGGDENLDEDVHRQDADEEADADDYQGLEAANNLDEFLHEDSNPQAPGGTQSSDQTMSCVEDQYLEGSAARIQSDAAGATSSTQMRHLEADIDLDSFEFWRKNTLVCLTKLSTMQLEVKKLQKNEDSINRLREIRNMQVSDAKLPTELPKKCRARKHQPQARGFPTHLKKLDKRRKKPMDENPRNPNAKFLIDEGLAESYQDDAWGDLAHFPNKSYLFSLLRGYPREDREKFQTEWELARSHWYCGQCDFDYKNFKASDGKYILCEDCDTWRHYKCSGLNEQSTVDEVRDWKCPNCLTME